MKIIKFTAMVFSLIFVLSCTDETTNVTYQYDRTLVLLTDLEENSDFIIKIRGLLDSEFPDTKLEFVSASNFDVEEAAYRLSVAGNEFSAGSIFVGIVEPGANSKRMVFEINDRKFVVPDNGIASFVLHNNPEIKKYYIENSSSIGGYDPQAVDFEVVYREAIKSLLNSIQISEFGSLADSVIMLDIVEPRKENDCVVGELLYFDHFGNGKSNIPNSLLSFEKGDLIEIHTKDKSFFAVYGENYASVPTGGNVFFANASGKLDFAVNFGNLKERYSLNSGENIKICKAEVKVGVLMYNNSSVASDIEQQMISTVSSSGIPQEQFNFVTKNAEGDDSKLLPLAADLLKANVDLIVSISTPASQAAVRTFPDSIPMIYTYVTDPSSAGILGQRENFTGLSDATNFTDFVEFVGKLLPGINDLGTIYNSDEFNSEYANGRLEAITQLYGMDLSSKTATNLSQAQTAFDELQNSGVGAIIVVADNTMSGLMPEFAPLAWANGNKMPIIGDSGQHAKDGALASISVDYKELATETGNYVVNVVLGTDADNIEKKKFPTKIISINKATAQKINFVFPDDILSSANKIYE